MNQPEEATLETVYTCEDAIGPQEGLDIGANVLEIGLGYGAATVNRILD